AASLEPRQATGAYLGRSRAVKRCLLVILWLPFGWIVYEEVTKMFRPGGAFDRSADPALLPAQYVKDLQDAEKTAHERGEQFQNSRQVLVGMSPLPQEKELPSPEKALRDLARPLAEARLALQALEKNNFSALPAEFAAALKKMEAAEIELVAL